MLIACPRRAGHRRRRPHRAGPGRDGRDDRPARARPLLRLPRRRLRPRHRRRPAARRPHRRHLLARLALVLLRRRARSRVAAFVVLQKTLHLPRRQARDVQHRLRSAPTCIVGGVSLLLVWVSLAGRQVRLGLAGRPSRMVGGSAVALLLAVLRRVRAPSSRSSRCGCSATAPSTLAVARLACSSASRCSAARSSSASTSRSRAASRPTHRRPDDDADDRRPVRLVALVSGRIITRTGRWKRVAGRRRGPADRPGLGAARHHRLRHAALGDRRLHGAAGPRPRRDHAEPGARRAEHGRPGRHGRGQLDGRVLPLARRRDRRLGARRGAQPPGHGFGVVRAGQARHPRDRERIPRRYPRPAGAAGTGSHRRRARLRAGHRRHISRRRPVGCDRRRRHHRHARGAPAPNPRARDDVDEVPIDQVGR